jgi:pyridoxine 4-dehydrogenase
MAVPTSSIPDTLGGEIVIGGDLRVHRFGFGSMRITGKGIWGPPADPENAKALLKHVVRSGVNFIDTADSYGPRVSEELIAEALHPYPDDLVIATKVGLVRTGPDQWPVDARPERIKKCCEESLQRLKLDRIDLYQLHRIDPKVPVAESLGAMLELQRAGKIRHIGISQVSVKEYEACKKIVPIVSVQNSYSLFDRTYDDVVDACAKDGVAFLPWFPLGGGQDVRHDTLERIARAKGVTEHQVAIAWLLQRSPNMLPIAGTSSIAHFDQNLVATSVLLSEEELRQLDSLE